MKTKKGIYLLNADGSSSYWATAERREEISESTDKSLVNTGQHEVETVELEQENE